MDDDVKPVGRRQRKALETRRRVLDAAEQLFVSDGYSATTIAAIAETADVAVQTVYSVFGTKRAVLTELLAARTVGDDGAAPLRDRQDWQAMEAESEPRRQLALLASIATRIGGRMAPLYDVMAEAAGSDPELAAVFRQQQEARYKDQRRVARSLAHKDALRDGMSEVRATDVMWALANPRTHRALVGERRWPTDEYEGWLGQLLAGALLKD